MNSYQFPRSFHVDATYNANTAHFNFFSFMVHSLTTRRYSCAMKVSGRNSTSLSSAIFSASGHIGCECHTKRPFKLPYASAQHDSKCGPPAVCDDSYYTWTAAAICGHCFRHRCFSRFIHSLRFNLITNFFLGERGWREVDIAPSTSAVIFAREAM